MAIKDISNTTFGNIKVIDFAYSKHDKAYWNCLCSCGKSFVAMGKEIRNGTVKHCGCKKRENLSKARINKENLVGKKFRRLLVVEKLPKYKKERTHYRCICDCGNEKIVYVSDLKNGNVSSCGCYRSECHRVDITGQKFGKLTAIKPIGRNKQQSVLWECKCDCGKSVKVTTGALRFGNSKSCGCLSKDKMYERLEDLTGQEFNKLKVLEFAYSKNQTRYWKCLCSCGNITYVATNLLKGGHTKSCGCLNYEPTVITHGLSKHTPLYFVWKELKHRCYNPKHKSYYNYGARGIKVCNEWLNDFKVFYEWAIQNGYKEEKLSNGKNKWTIDRIDVNGDYCPENCRFITNAEQMKNKQNTIYLTYNNQTKPFSDWLNEYNIPYGTLYSRLFKYKWDIEKSLKTPVRSDYGKNIRHNPI